MGESLKPAYSSSKEINYLWTTKDTSKKIIILDKIPVAKLNFHIDSQEKYRKVPCISQHDNCPLCEVADPKGRFSRSKGFILLSVLDLTPWSTKDGKEMFWTKKIFAVENEAQRKIINKYLEKYGTTRGMVLELSRSGAKGEGSCGIPMFEEMLTEEQLQKYANPEYKNPEGKVVKAAGADLIPFDYSALYKLPTASELRSKYSIAAPLGSKDDVSSTDESAPWYEGDTFDPNDYEDSIAD